MDMLIVFIMGSIIGSFLNVCIYRLPKGISVVLPPSSCPSCKKGILWHDNIPILSFIILRGKCRFCKTAISSRYFIVELISAVLTLLLYIAFGVTARFFAYSILTYGLIIATFIDFEIHEIPDVISIGGIVAGLVFSFAVPSLFDMDSNLQSLVRSLIGMLAGGASIYIMGFFGELVFKKEAMGGGDVKLMAMIGSFLGWKLVMMTFFMAPIFGVIPGLVMKLREGREIMPYGPYISLAALFAVFFGNTIIGILFYGL